MASRQPSLFITHGAPTLPLEPGEARRFLETLGDRLPNPEAVLCISAHWEAARPTVSMAAEPKTIHDFLGFPQELYGMTYRAPGAPDLAWRAKDLLDRAGLETASDPARGLDHGAWVPMKLIFPDANIPVTQISVQTSLGPGHHLALGEALAPLRDEGVLIMGSGSATHNLADFRGMGSYGAPPMDYVENFNDWLIDAVTEGRVDDLVEYREQAPEAARTHPSEEHFLPLHVALGAAVAEDPRGTLLHTSYTYGILAMTCFAWGSS